MQKFTQSPHTLGGSLGDRHSQCSWKDLVTLFWPCSVGLGSGTACSLLGALLTSCARLPSKFLGCQVFLGDDAQGDLRMAS